MAEQALHSLAILRSAGGDDVVGHHCRPLSQQARLNDLLRVCACDEEFWNTHDPAHRMDVASQSAGPHLGSDRPLTFLVQLFHVVYKGQVDLLHPQTPQPLWVIDSNMNTSAVAARQTRPRAPQGQLQRMCLQPEQRAVADEKDTKVMFDENDTWMAPPPMLSRNTVTRFPRPACCRTASAISAFAAYGSKLRDGHGGGQVGGVGPQTGNSVGSYWACRRWPFSRQGCRG